MLPLDGVLATEPRLMFRATKSVRLENVVLVNNGDAVATCNLYVNISGLLRPVSPVGAESLQLGAGKMAVERMPIILAPGNELHGRSSAGNAVTWVLCGLEI